MHHNRADKLRRNENIRKKIDPSKRQSTRERELIPRGNPRTFIAPLLQQIAGEL